MYILVTIRIPKKLIFKIAHPQNWQNKQKLHRFVAYLVATEVSHNSRRSFSLTREFIKHVISRDELEGKPYRQQRGKPRC